MAMSRSLYDKLYRRFGVTLSDSELIARSNRLVEAELALWPAAAFSPECKSRLKRTRVAVVGAGFAGMMAAWWLCQREEEIEVVVFEARAEVGGRVRSDETFTQGRIIEFGAELVGANHPVWLGLARDLGVGLMTRTGENHFALLGLEMKFRIDGKDIDPNAAEQLTKKMRAVFVEIGKDASRIKDANRPWDQPELQMRFDNMSVADKLTKPRPDGLGITDKLLLRSIQMLLENNVVTPLKNINYLGLLCLVNAGRFGSQSDDPDFLGFWEQTEAFRCTDGCQTLVRTMAERLTNAQQGGRKKYKFTLLTRTPVKTIKIDAINPRPVTLTWDRSAAATTANPGPQFDYVILATPPSVWSDITITPEHPENTMGPIQMGPAVKFFSNLADRFWIGEKAAPSGISSDIGMIWEGTDNQTRIDKQEIELSVFAGGLARTGRVLTGSEFKNGLRKLYPGYDKSNRGKKTKLVNWADEEKFIKTGYSCPKLGHMFTVAPELQKPLNNGRLFLAGEHTQTDFFGFMEGALRSGRRAAEAVIAHVCSGPVDA
jgi:monoamine oxidase